MPVCELLRRVPSWEITHWIAFYLEEQDAMAESIDRRTAGTKRGCDRVLTPRNPQEAVALLDTYFDVNRS